MKRIFTVLISLFSFPYLFVNQISAASKDLGPGPLEGLGRFQVTPQGKSVAPYSDSLELILSTVIGFLTIFGGLYFIITFIVGGLGWATAGGDTNKVEEAKKRMTNGALGLIIVVAAYSVIYIIGSVLGLDILNVSRVIQEDLFK